TGTYHGIPIFHASAGRSTAGGERNPIADLRATVSPECAGDGASEQNDRTAQSVDSRLSDRHPDGNDLLGHIVTPVHVSHDLAHRVRVPCVADPYPAAGVPTAARLLDSADELGIIRRVNGDTPVVDRSDLHWRHPPLLVLRSTATGLTPSRGREHRTRQVRTQVRRNPAMRTPAGRPGPTL